MPKGDNWPADDRGLFPRGTILDGQYEIVGYIGRGAFGTVYKGQQRSIRRPVAIKVLMPNSDPSVRDRFMREARTAAAIKHENVVAIHEFGVHENAHPYIVMELLEGHCLEDELRSGPLDRGRALNLFIPCLEALREAHQLGIVHKDLKPSNLFVTHPGTRRERLTILDFGVARLTGDADEALKQGGGGETLPGQAVGTPPYMAPEYIESQTVTPATDVYQMGLILCEALSGKQVVSADVGWSALVIHVSGDLELPSEVFNDESLAPVLLKAIERDHTLRYKDAGDFLRALELIAAAGPKQEDVVTIKTNPSVAAIDPLEPALVEEAPKPGSSGAPVSGKGWLLFGGSAFGFVLVCAVLLVGVLVAWWGLTQRSDPPAPPGVTKKNAPKSNKSSRESLQTNGPRLKIAELNRKVMRRQIKKTGWQIFKEDRIKNVKNGDLYILTDGELGGSVMRMRLASELEAEASSKALDGESVSIYQGKWVLSVSVVGEPKEARALMRTILAK